MRVARRTRQLPLLLLPGIFVGCALLGGSGEVRFAAIGNMPYSEQEEAELLVAFEEMRERGMSFVIHAGDIFKGDEPCPEERYRARRELFDRSPIPLVVIPGDNEILDCSDITSTKALERFRGIVLRDAEGKEQIVGGGASSRSLTVERQAGRPENVQWVVRNVQFGGINLPAGHYNLRKKALQRLLADDFRFVGRLFRTASDEGRDAVVITMHANPSLVGPAREEYRAFDRYLNKLVARFGKPVLLVQADAHAHAFERSFQGLPNWTILQVSNEVREWNEITFSKSTGTFSVNRCHGPGCAP